MSDTILGFLGKLVDNTSKLLIIAGILVCIIGALGYLPFGTQIPIRIENSVRIGLSIFGILLVIIGIYLGRKENEIDDGGKNFIFCGLRDEPRVGNTFQDFIIERPGGNINAVYYLWADTFKACTINAEVDTKEHFLRIIFLNKQGSYSGNIAIRPFAEQALVNPPGRNKLTFEARIHRDNLKTNSLTEAAVSIRIINGWLQHWEYSDKPGEYMQFVIKGRDWQKHEVKLFGEHWSLFKGDGNLYRGPKTPNFDIISSVIFEVGSVNIPGRPGAGQGAIDIRKINLETNG